MVIATRTLFRLSSESVEGTNAQWWFQIEDVSSGQTFEATDSEAGFSGDRLELLALIRGLEAVQQSARLEISTSSRYIKHGLSYGLEKWRDRDWRWESFGSLVPIKNDDLWRRVDQALRFHDLQAVHLGRVRTPEAIAERRAEVSTGPVCRISPETRPTYERTIRVHRIDLRSPADPWGSRLSYASGLHVGLAAS